MSQVVQVTDKTFQEEVLDAKTPVVVDFWAPWCMPCRMMAPILDEVAIGAAGTAKVCKVNTDENQHIAAQYGIMSIPSLVFFKDGVEVGRAVGVQQADVLQGELDKLAGTVV